MADKEAEIKTNAPNPPLTNRDSDSLKNESKKQKEPAKGKETSSVDSATLTNETGGSSIAGKVHRKRKSFASFVKNKLPSGKAKDRCSSKEAGEEKPNKKRKAPQPNGNDKTKCVLPKENTDTINTTENKMNLSENKVNTSMATGPLGNANKESEQSEKTSVDCSPKGTNTDESLQRTEEKNPEEPSTLPTPLTTSPVIPWVFIVVVFFGFSAIVISGGAINANSRGLLQLHTLSEKIDCYIEIVESDMLMVKKAMKSAGLLLMKPSDVSQKKETLFTTPGNNSFVNDQSGNITTAHMEGHAWNMTTSQLPVINTTKAQ